MNFFCTQVDGPLTGGAYNYIRSRAYTWQFTEYPVIGGEIYIYIHCYALVNQHKSF